ncbi:glycosyltransferase family 39 protein [Maricaulaceae bacterium NA33B04]|nr:glycosyltransferase family 39 protein [Maricaulaceae bacterium NA33B04]
MDAFVQRITETPEKGGLTRPGWIVLMVVAVAALLPGLFNVPPMDRDESRYAQASRQMMETGDYLNIKFQEYDRHKQPAGTYWLQSLAAAPFGGADAPIGAHRLPGLVMALVAVAITAWLGARFFTPPVGLAAGIILATTLVLSIEAKTAKTDAILLGFGMLAQASLMMLMLKVREARPKFIGWPALLWTAIGCSLLVKGPIFFMVTALTAIVYTAWKRDPKLLLKLRPLPGVALALLIFVPWFLAINLETGWAFYYEAVGHSMLDKVGEAQEAHTGPLGFHLMATALTLWPSVALLGLGILAAISMRGRDEVKFLIAWIVPTYIVFEIVATKLPHYTLPSFPAIAILIGLGIANAPALLKDRLSWTVHIATVVAAVIVSIALGAAALYASDWLSIEPELTTYLTIPFALVAAVAIVGLAIKPSLLRLLGLGAAAAALYAALFAVAIPALHPMWTSHHMAQVVASFDGCETPRVIVGGYREPSVAFNLGTETWLAYDGADTAQQLLANPQCGIAIVDQAWQGEFQATIEAAGAELRVLAAHDGFNYVKDDVLSLTYVTLESSNISASTR